MVFAISYDFSCWQAAKKHLTQRMENLDGKMDDQRELSKEIKENVCADIFIDDCMNFKVLIGPSADNRENILLYTVCYSVEFLPNTNLNL